MILRSKEYYWSLDCNGGWWHERFIHQNKMSLAFNSIYKRENTIIDSGYSICGS